jgi:DNA-binding GntR family transcriptional regulator
MKLPKIEKTTLRERVYSPLREMIIAGEILPGHTITLRDLAEKFDVSVAPVREALLQLECERVVVRRNNRDYRINTLSPAQFEEIYNIRRIVEPTLVEQACLNHTDAAVAEVAKALHHMQESARNVKRYIFYNHEFHFSIYRQANMPILLEIVNGLWSRLGPYLSLNVKPEDIESTYQTHIDMLAAFRERDPKGCKNCLLLDMDYSHAYLLPYIS